MVGNNRKEYMKEYRQTYATIRKINTITLMDIIKEEIGCVKCGKKFPPYMIDSHHIGYKKHLVSVLVKDGKIDLLLSEIQKCILLCANCHREIHHENSRYRL